ncbi:MAG: glycosyltransferase family 4 protein [Candidatus Acidiferrales bacterium]
MKIALICNEYPPRPHGGIGTFVQTLARALHLCGHDVTVVGLGAKDEETTDCGVRVITLRTNKLKFVGNFISRIRLRRWLSSRVKSGQIDVIEVPDYLGLLPFGVPGCAVVVRLHISGTAIFAQAGKKIGRGIHFYERRTLAANSNWIAVSQFIFDSTKSLFGVSPRRWARIYNPVSPIPSHLPVVPELPSNFVLYAGQVTRRKGAVVLAHAARELMMARPDLHLVYVGGEMAIDGGRPVFDEIQETVGPELAPRLHILGRLDHDAVLTCMQRAKMYAFPSRLEALPLVVLEAMSCGLPIVCTSEPPGPEMVEDGVNGLLADPTSPHDFAEKIARLLDDPALAGRLAATAKRTVAERFSLDRCLDETEQFYRECLSAMNTRTKRPRPGAQGGR